MNNMPLELILKCYETMLQSRYSDLRTTNLYNQGKTPFQISSVGHEGMAALGFLLEQNDYVFPHYRDKALLLAKGFTVEAIARNVLMKKTSECAGRSMTGHYSSREHNIYAIASPVASQCLPAVGAAWSLKRNQQKGVVLCALGDASSRQGEFYEAVCLAKEHHLPVLFVIEDNKYGISTPTEKQMPLRLGVFGKSLYTKVNATNPISLYQQAQDLFSKLRTDQGPHILWCEMDRLESHASSDDHGMYRAKEELFSMVDPISVLDAYLLNNNILNFDEITILKDRIKSEVDEIFACVSKEADASVDYDIVIDNTIQSTEPIDSISIDETEMDMVQAVNLSLSQALKMHSDMLLFGQDIEDPKGGVFGFTKGLSTQFPNKVINAPLAEASMVGAGIGWASTGAKACVELQFIDFISPAYNQIASQLATLEWRSNGKWKSPLVVYAPYGGYVAGGGNWHSQSNESLLAHIPGLQVLVPSHPEDVLSSFHQAFASDEPTFILIPKSQMRIKHPVKQVKLHSLGRGKIVQHGVDITVVCWGNSVKLATDVQKALYKYQIQLEIINAHSIAPFDYILVKKSIEKTQRLLVIQEDNMTCGFAGNIVAKMVSDKATFQHLRCPPAIVTRADQHIPFAVDLSSLVFPQIEDVTMAILDMMREDS